MMFPRSEWTIRQATPADRDDAARFLASAHRRHLHLDWSQPLELVGSAPFLIAQRGRQWLACLACPPDPVDVAWLRLFAVAPGAPLTPSFRKLIQAVVPEVARMGTSRISALATRTWLRPLLEDTGFAPTNEMTFFEWDGGPLDPVGQSAIRDMLPEDLPAVQAVDERAFQPPWQHSQKSLEQALEAAALASVYELEGQIVGYQISTASALGAHLARLAVEPRYQGRGIGRELVLHALTALGRLGLGRMTVNTQADNLPSQRLYQSLGFRETGMRIRLYERFLHV